MGDAGPRGNPVPSGEVRAMFDRIAPIYDAMNTVMTLGLDAAWRRAAARAATLGPDMEVIDVACGTGALTRELARVCSVTGVDVSTGMLDRARRRGGPGARYRLADALDLPFRDASFEAATIAFGLRNMPDYERCLAEMARVTRSGGRIVILEISPPGGRLGRLLSGTWLERVVPLLGRVVGAGSAYRYLPQSVRAYPSPPRMAELLAGAGLRDIAWRRLPPGLVTLHVARRP